VLVGPQFISEGLLFAVIGISPVMCAGVIVAAGQSRKWGCMWLVISERQLRQLLLLIYNTVVVYTLCTAQAWANSRGEGFYFKFFHWLFRERISVSSR